MKKRIPLLLLRAHLIIVDMQTIGIFIIKKHQIPRKKNLAKENQITLTCIINEIDKNIPIDQNSLLLHDSNLNNAEESNKIFTNCKDEIKKHISNLYQENLDAIDSFLNRNSYTLKESQRPDQSEKVSNGIKKPRRK